tara:strand:+ start:1135 stop:1272 length:138 start_codon:yes stop_codon:yes gene_type:complete
MMFELIGSVIMTGLSVIGCYGIELKRKQSERGSISLSKEAPKKKD